MIRKLVVLIAALVVIAAWATPSLACGIEGTVTWRDGSRSNKSTTVSTSWNSQKAYPSRGRYTLELGSSACGQSMTVYLNGGQGRRVTLPRSGNARVDFTAR